MTAALEEPVVEVVPDGTYVLGVRHHGPGSARGVLAELDRIRPNAVLVEGPADADSLVPLVAAKDMQPPVALLAYDATTPAHALFWPYAVFSPEWSTAPERGSSTCRLGRCWHLVPRGARMTGPRSRRRRGWRSTKLRATSRPSSGRTRSPCWRTPPVTTTRSDGGTTSSNRVRTARGSRPSPRRWRSCATTRTRGIRTATPTMKPVARHTCGPCSATSARRTLVASSLSAAPGTRRRLPTHCPPRPRMPVSSKGCGGPRPS